MNVLITGASEGIGFETALRYAEKGSHKVIVVARRADKLNELKVKAPEGFVLPVSMDLSEYDYSKLEECLAANGINHIDILIHNAGYLINRKFEDLTQTDWDDIYKVNVIGVAMLTRFLMPHLGGKEHSHIIMIGSIGGITGSLKFPGLSAYSSSKGALSIMAEVLALEFQERNVFVNCLALGSVQTEMLQKAFPGYTSKTTPFDISDFIYEFGLKGWRYFNGKTVPVSSSNP